MTSQPLCPDPYQVQTIPYIWVMNDLLEQLSRVLIGLSPWAFSYHLLCSRGDKQ